jgi:hypothetical protein
MSVERAVSPAASSRTVIAALAIGAAIGAAAVMLLAREQARRFEESTGRVTARAVSPNHARVAIAWEAACANGSCTDFRIGASDTQLASVGERRSGHCDEVVWTPDGKRVGFVMDGAELLLYDPESLKLVGTVALMTDEAARIRLARGITFSENGNAVTFDDCPRGRSGCRAGVVGVPQ